MNQNNEASSDWDFKAEWAKAMTTHCRIEDGCIIIPAGGDYDIELDDVSTPANLLRTVFDLSQKQWVTKQIIYEVIGFASEHHQMGIVC